MALQLLSLVVLLGQAAAASCPACAADEPLALLQTVVRTVERGQDPVKTAHYWPHPRGAQGRLSQTQYGVSPEQLRHLNSSLSWKWVHPLNLSAFVWGTLIDREKNIIVCANQGIFKYTDKGKLLWQRTDIHNTEMPVLMGNALFGMTQTMAQMFSLDIQTGRTLWWKKIAKTTGQEGDMVEAYNGVLVAAVGWGGEPSPVGTPALRTIGVNATTGQQLWSYTPECGIWNIMALFPDEDSTIFMDDCGGVYRLKLFTGALVWKQPGSTGSMTDGGNALGRDGSVYTCSNGPNTMSTMNNLGSNAGRLRKYRLEDGSLLWEKVLPNACMNFPGVSPDGKTIVLADGANTLDPPMKWVKGQPLDVIEKEWQFQQELLRNKTQLTYYGRDNLEASLSGFDTSTGELKWTHAVEPWYGMAFALDEERAYLYDKGQHPFGHCGPPHWGGPTIDQEGKIYVARSDGNLYIYDPVSGTETKFHTGDGAMMGGVSFAPGLMVVPTCSWVYVFHF